MPNYSSAYQVSLLETGESPESWGDYTNDNYEKLEAAIGLAVEIDVNNPPTGSSLETVDETTSALTWITVEGSLAGQSGSEGRCSYVEFKSTGVIPDVVNVRVRGNTDSNLPTRSFIARNSLSGSSEIRLDVNGTGYAIRNGRTALVFSAVGGAVGSAEEGSFGNALGKLQLFSVDLVDSSSANFWVVPNMPLSLRVSDGLVDHIVIDTESSRLIIGTTDSGGVIESAGTDKDITISTSGNADINLVPSGAGKIRSAPGDFVGPLTGNVAGSASGHAAKIVTTDDPVGPGAPSYLIMTPPTPAIGVGVGKDLLTDPVLSYQNNSSDTRLNVCDTSLADTTLGQVKTDTLSADVGQDFTIEGRPQLGGPTGTVTMEDPVLENMSVDDWSSATHSHETPNTAGVLAYSGSIAPVRVSVSIEDISNNAVLGQWGDFLDISVNQSGIDEQNTGGGGQARSWAYYGKAFATPHNVENPVRVDAFLKYIGANYAGSGPSPTGGWENGDRCPIIKDNYIGGPMGSLSNGQQSGQMMLGPQQFGAGGLSGDPVSVQSFFYGLEEIDWLWPSGTPVAFPFPSHDFSLHEGPYPAGGSCGWGWNDDEVFLILGARMWEGTPRMCKHLLTGPALPHGRTRLVRPRWYSTMAAVTNVTHIHDDDANSGATTWAGSGMYTALGYAGWDHVGIWPNSQLPDRFTEGDAGYGVGIDEHQEWYDWEVEFVVYG